MLKQIRKYFGNKDGAAAIEAAIVFPILICSLFAILGFGTYMFGSHQAQRTVEETAREARVVSEPTETQLLTLLTDNLKDAPFGTYTPSVVMVSQYGGEYAELVVDYSFNFEVPFFGDLGLTSSATTEVKLRLMPA